MRTIQQSSAPNFFFCFNLILLFTSLSFPQSVRDEIKKIGGSPQFNKSFTPLNLPIDTTTTSVFFYGDKITTKVSKDSGGTRAIPYMRAWSDNLIQNGSFDSNISGINTRTDPPDTLEWVAAFGALTGAMHIVDISDAAEFNDVYYPYATNDDLIPVQSGSRYNISFNLIIDSLSGTLAKVNFASVIKTGFLKNYTAEGSYSFDSTFIAESNGYISFSSFSLGDGYFSYYIDNLSITDENDSTFGYTYLIPRPIDTTAYYYSQSLSWVQKDKDTIWVAAETDTVTVYPYVAPEFEEGAYTSDGNELYTIDGNRIYAKQEGE